MSYMRTCSMVIVTKFHQNRFNGSWDMLCWQKEEEEEEERKKERRTQEKQDTSVCNGCVTRHVPFAKGTGKVRRMDEVTALLVKKTFWPRDPKSKFELISFEEGSTWCICMSYIDKVRNIEEMHFLVKVKVWPLWPHMTPGWPMTP